MNHVFRRQGVLLPIDRTIAVLFLLSCNAGMAGRDPVHWSQLMRTQPPPLTAWRGR